MSNYQKESGRQRATSETAQSKVVIVLGMHRTGTSLCMNILGELGVRLDSDLILANEHNERGFFESRKIMELNEQIFRVLGITWHSLFPRQLNEGWVDSYAVMPLRQQLGRLLEKRNQLQRGVWGFKDPRLCLLLPLYKRVFADQHIEPLYVVCVRNPGAVAASLKRRNGFPRILSELLWMDHTTRAINGAGINLKAVVHYETWFEDPWQEAQRLGAALGLEADNQNEPQGARLRNLIARELDHCSGDAGSFELESTRKTYNYVQDGRNNQATAEVTEIQRGLELGLFPLVVLRQLFWRTAQHDYFSEANSCCIYTDNEPRRRVVRFEIPAQAQNLTGLRLDPSDSPGKAHFCSIKLLGRDNRVIWEWNGEGRDIQEWEISDMTFASEVEGRGAMAYFSTGEPSLMLPLHQFPLDRTWQGGAVEFEFAPEMSTCGACHANSSNLPIRGKSSPRLQLESLKPLAGVLKTEARLEAACQVFWRTEDLDYFTEANSCFATTDVVPGMKIMRVVIPPTVHRITGLRLDPSDRSGLARIESVRLLNSAGEPVWEWDGTPSAILKWQAFNLTLLSQLEQSAVFAHFHSDDPILILPVSAAQLALISGRGGTVELGFEWIGMNSSLPSLDPQPIEEFRPDDARKCLSVLSAKR